LAITHDSRRRASWTASRWIRFGAVEEQSRNNIDNGIVSDDVDDYVISFDDKTHNDNDVSLHDDYVFTGRDSRFCPAFPERTIARLWIRDAVRF
jgi:hypothetical protein